MKRIKSVPEWAWSKYYIVARKRAGEWCFFDAWCQNEGDDAMAQAWEIDGEVFRASECEKE